MKKKNVLTLSIGGALGLLLILLWLYFVPIYEITGHIREISLKYVVYGSIVYLSAYFVRALRWRRIIYPQCKISIWHSWLYSMGGNLINYLIPIRAGDVTKAWFVKRNHCFSMAESLPSVFIDKCFDTLAILGVLLVLPFLKIKMSLSLIILLILLALVFTLSFAVLVFASWYPGILIRFFSLILNIIPHRFRNKVGSFIHKLVEGLNFLKYEKRVMLYAVGYTLVGVLLDGLYFYLMFRAFGIELAFLVVLFGYALINLSYALPQPPAQLGSNEWIMIIVFSLGFDLTKSAASAVMAFAHMLTAVLMGVVGGIAIALSGYEVLHMIVKGEKIG